MKENILFHFPLVGWFITLLIPFFLGQFALSRYRRRMKQEYASLSLLSHLLIDRSPLLKNTKMVGWAIIWILLCLSAMSPYGNLRYSDESTNTFLNEHSYPKEILFLVDTSASMGVPDGNNHQTRLETAKVIMEDLIRRMNGQTISVYAFTSELTSIVPPTVDYLFTRLAINNLHINEGDIGGTLFEPVLNNLKERLFSKPSRKQITILMFTDGGDTQLEQLSGNDLKKEEEKILNALPNPMTAHFNLFTIGLGSLKGQPIPRVNFNGKEVLSKLEPLILQRLSHRERGKYYMAEQWNSWDLAGELMNQIEQSALDQSQEQSKERRVMAVKQEELITDRYFQIPLGIALLFYFLNLLLPDVRRL